MRTRYYRNFKKNGHIDQYWNERGLEPSADLKILFAGMLQENPDKRWTVQNILDCDWMKNDDLPSEDEIHAESFSIVGFLYENLVHYHRIEEPEGIQKGFEGEVKGGEIDDEEVERYQEEIKGYVSEIHEKGLNPREIAPYHFDWTQIMFDE